MAMAERQVDASTFGFRAMLSPDPFMGASGYPLLLATGETADGRTPLVDRQHSHDLFMELAATYSYQFAKTSSWPADYSGFSAANHEARTTEKPALLPPYTIGRVRIRSSLDMKLGQNRGGDVEQIEITRRDTDTHQDTRANSASHPSARFAGDDQGRRPAIAIALPRLQGRPLVRVPIAPVYPGPVPQRNKFSISEFE